MPELSLLRALAVLGIPLVFDRIAGIEPSIRLSMPELDVG